MKRYSTVMNITDPACFSPIFLCPESEQFAGPFVFIKNRSKTGYPCRLIKPKKVGITAAV